MDTVNTPTIRKKLRKLSAQDPGESRRRWQCVTEALQQRDIDTATDEKHQVRVGVCVGGGVIIISGTCMCACIYSLM